MPRTHFTVGDVDALIPTLERIFVDVLQLRAGLRGLETKLERAKALFRGYYEALSDQLTRVKALGGEVKDVETGLVDFPSRRLGEEILLCWRFGEKKIEYWHPVDGGFAARQPVDAEFTRAPQPLD
jgi:hypothetical protein